MKLAVGFLAFALSAAVAHASDFARDPADLGSEINKQFSARTMDSRVTEPRCKEGPHLKSCAYKLGSIEIVSQGKPSTRTTSKISVSLADSGSEDIANFMIAAVILIQTHSPSMNANDASHLVSALTKGAAAEGKANKIVGDVYYSVMRYGSQFDFFVMPE